MKPETNKNMNKQNLHLLILEDNPIDARLMVTKLENEGFVLEWKRVETEKTFRKALAEKPDIILADYELPLYKGLSAIKLKRQIAPEIPIILISGTIGNERAVECMKAGAIDYVLKNRLSRLGFVVKRALKEAEAHSERKKAEQALIESEEKLQDLFENANDLIQSVNIDSKFIFVNKKWKEILGYTDEEIKELKFQDTLRKDCIYHCEEIFKGLIKGESFNNVKTVFITKNGKEIFVEGNINSRRKNGKFVSSRGIFRDITERMKAEKALCESEERFRSIAETAQDSIFIKDRMLKYTYVNPSMEKLFELPASKLIGQTDEELFGKDAGAHIRDVDSRVLDGEIVEEEHTKPVNDIPTTFHVIKVPMRNSSGKIIGLAGIARDITERKQAEEQNRKFNKIIETTSQSVIITNIKGTVLYVNPSYYAFSGFVKDEVIGRSMFRFAHKKGAIKLAKEVAPALIKKGHWQGDMTVVKKDKQIVSVDLICSLLSDEKNKPEYFVAIFSDITERKQAEVALRESEEKYRAVLEQSADNIYLMDIETKKILESNSTLRNFLGYSDGEMKKLTVYDFIAHQKDDINENIEKVINQGRVFIGERKYLRKDSSPVDVEVSSSFITFGNRKALCVISRDITKRKKVEKALHESEERYRAIIEQSNDAIYIYRGDKFLFINDRVCEITGYTKEVLDELNMWSLLHPDDRERIVEIGRKRAKGEKVPSTYEARIVRINGDIRQCEFRVRTISYKGEYAVMGAVKDVTESRKAQDELKKYAETQKALLKEVNHRVKNNLTAILGLLSMEEARTENKAYATFINKFKGRISGLAAIHSLLSESGWIFLNLSQLYEQIIKASIACIPNSNSINFYVSPSTIRINSNQAHHLTLVINELITNSIKHGQNFKNEIQINVDIKKDKENVIITYRDTGKGYPQEFIDGDYSNIGVGFDLIKGIVTHSLKGELQIYNDNGAVTVLKFELDKEIYI